MQSDTQHFNGGGNDPPDLVGRGQQPPLSNDFPKSDNVIPSQVSASPLGLDDSCRENISDNPPRQKSWAEILSRKIPSSQGGWVNYQNDEDETMADGDPTGASPTNSDEFNVDEIPADKSVGKGDKGAIESNKNWRQTYCDDWTTASQAPVETEKKAESTRNDDVKFLAQVGESEINDRRLDHHNLHETNAFQKMIKESPGEVLRPLLNSITHSEKVPKLELINPFDLTISEMETILGNQISDFATKMESRCNAYKHVIDKAETEYQSSAKSTTRMIPRKAEDLENFPSNEKISNIKKLNYEAFKDLTFYAAARCIEKARIVENQIYFPMVGDPSYVSNAISKFTKDTESLEIPVKDVTKQIELLLLGTSFFNPKDETQYFTLKKNTALGGRLLCVVVTHLPMDNPRHFFQRNFLTPLDRILRVVPQEKLIDGKVKTHVVIDLGSETVPPRCLIPGRLRDNIQEQLKHFDEQEMIESIEKEIEWLTKHCEVNFPQETKKLKSDREGALRFYKTKKQNLEDKFQQLSKISPHKPLPDVNQMNVKIIYSQQFCPLCHTTQHSFRNCTERGCKLCYNRNHPSYKCTLKCNCRKRGRIHAAEECPNHREEFHSGDGPGLEQIRKENKEKKEQFFKSLGLTVSGEKLPELEATEASATKEDPRVPSIEGQDTNMEESPIQLEVADSDMEDSSTIETILVDLQQSASDTQYTESLMDSSDKTQRDDPQMGDNEMGHDIPTTPNSFQMGSFPTTPIQQSQMPSMDEQELLRLFPNNPDQPNQSDIHMMGAQIEEGVDTPSRTPQRALGKHSLSPKKLSLAPSTPTSSRSRMLRPSLRPSREKGSVNLDQVINKRHPALRNKLAGIQTANDKSLDPPQTLDASPQILSQGDTQKDNSSIEQSL